MKKLVSMLVLLAMLLSCTAMAETLLPYTGDEVVYEGYAADLGITEDRNSPVYKAWKEKLGNVSINWSTGPWADFDTKTSLFLNTGDLPDIVWLRNSTDVISNYGDLGYFLNFMDYLDYMPNLKSYLETYPQIAAMKTEDGALYCLNDARKLCGRPMSAEEALAAVLPDRPYYDATGGGVTVSGGECMLHIDFLEAFLRLCHENGLRTAVDTAGNVPFSAFERILPHADLFLYDVKCVTEETHIAGTGASNRLILDNLRRLLKTRADSIIIRVPVVPGFNDNEEEIGKIAAFFRAHGRPAKIELLPYHRLGENKNAALGREGFTAEPPSKELMARLNALFDDLR